MYQKYHEVKGSLDELKLLIEKSHGPLPEDLLEQVMGLANPQLDTLPPSPRDSLRRLIDARPGSQPKCPRSRKG